MTKKLKSAISLLIALTMILSVSIGAFAAVDIGRYSSANNDGRLITADMTITYGDGETMNEAAVLGDGFHYSIAETAYYSLDLNSDTDSQTLQVGTGYNKNAATGYTEETTGTVTLTEENNTVEFEWLEEQNVKRLEMWIWPLCAINTYEIHYYDGSEWVKHAEGSLDQTQYITIDPDNGATAVQEKELKSSTAYIMTFDEVTTSKLRFVATSFKEGVTSAKIAEAVPRSNHNVNLLAEWTLGFSGNTNGWLDGVGTSSSNGSGKAGWNRFSSPYAYGFANSLATGITDKWTYQSNGSSNTFWPVYSYNRYSSITVSPSTDTNPENPRFAYSFRFPNAPHKISKVVFNLASSEGTVKEFQIWYNNTDVEYALGGGMRTSTPDEGANSNWKLATTVRGTFGKSSSTEVYLPETEAAEYWMIKVTEWEGSPAMNCPQIYVIPDNEIPTSHISYAAKHIFDNIQTDTADAFVASKEIYNIDNTFEYGNSSYNVVWQCSDKELFDVETGKVSFHEEEEKITLSATITSTEDDSISYVASREYTLLPRENECTIEVDGEETDLLTDGFLFSAYDAKKEGVSASSAPEKSVEISNEGTVIDYSWYALNKSGRLETWVYPAGAIDEYEIQTSEDGIVYNTVKAGSLFDTVSDETAEFDNASYYPVIFERQDTKYLRFVVKSFAEGFDKAYISEAKFINTNDVDLNAAPKGAEGTDKGMSHYTSSYVVSNTSDEDLMFRKNNSGVWPVYEDGTSPSVTPDGGEIWYATGFNLADVKINRIAIPFEDGSAKEIEILCADGEESGFDMSASFPPAPDKNAAYKSVAVVRGSFSAANSPVIDLVDAPTAKYWMVKVKGANAAAKMGRVQFYVADEADLSPVAEISKIVFDSVTTDTDSDSKVKLNMGIFDTYEYEGKEYSVAWESSNKLVDTETGEISEHEPDDKTTMTAIISDPENPSVSYCVTKDYELEGMLKITLFKGEEKTPDTGILNDNFYYTSYEASLMPEPRLAYYNPDKFVHYDSVDSGFEFHWDKARSVKRLQMWLWPADSITDYEIQISDDGNVWTTHHVGTFEDQYASDPTARPAYDVAESANANFYPIVFPEATKPVQHIRFVIKGFREPAMGTYIAEAYFHDTNDINYLALKTIPGTESHNSYKTRSRYVVNYYASDTTGGGASYRRGSVAMWPVWSSSGQSPNIKANPDVPEYSFYATSFHGAPALANKASITVATGEAFEIEVKCAETLASGFKWADFPPCPDTLASYKTVARISGKFGKGTHTFHFDNDFKSKHWMIKITKATGDFTFSGLGLYEIPVSELSPSSFASEGIFDGVSDTALDNVIKEKLNLPTTIEKNGKTFDVIWNYDSSMVNSDGTLIPALDDREMVLKASVGSPDEPYKHVLEKTYFLLGQDSSSRTSLCHEENVSIADASVKTLDAGLEHGFSFDGRKEVEIDFNEAMSGGVINLVKGEEVVLTVTREGDKVVLNKGTDEEASCEYADKIKLDISGNQYSVAAYNGTYYKVMLYNQNLLSKKSFDTIELVGAEGAALALDSIDVKVVSTALFDSIEQQFVFGKISPSYRATNLNGDLTLIDKVGDVTFTYNTDDSGVIDLTTTPGTGKVDLSAPGESYIKVTAKSDSANDSFTKTFKVLTGKDNLFGKAKSASPANPVEGSNSLYAADGNLESEFITTAGSYRINIDLQEVKAFSQIRIIEADTQVKISEFKIEASNDNVDFVEIYSNALSDTKGIDSNTPFPVPYTEARFIRLSVTKTSGAGENGIRDICGYSDMSDADKLKNDYDSLVKDLDIKDGTVIPKTGKFGTRFTLVANTPSVTITETADKSSWKVTAVSSNVEVNAQVTLNATNGTASAEPKTYSFIIFADTNIRDNVVSGSSGSSGSSGGRGGSSGSVPIATEPSQGSYTDNELAGHWGANEIKNLVKKGIVQGDGKSLNLSSFVTRAEFCKMVVAALGLELQQPAGTFFDISANDWFAQYAETAFKNGIMSGDTNGFRGNETISRQEMAVVLVNALKTKNAEITAETQASFTDNDSIAAWAKDSITLATGLGLLKGYDTGDFKPLNNLKRDEAMVVVYRLLSELDK